jgi:ElaB/YqjD/DUF883 family membrane-anchored ribosome-binding protein
MTRGQILLALLAWAAMQDIGWAAAAQTAQPAENVIVDAPRTVSDTALRDCQKPDESLIKFRGIYGGRLDLPDSEKIKLYNKQGRAFNDCMDKLIDSNTAEVNRIYNEGNATIRAVADAANRQQANLADKINAAIGGLHSTESQPDQTGWQFPDPDCVLPEKTLLKRVHRSSGASTAIAYTTQYDAQQQLYQSCVKSYIGQAAAEMRLITNDANTRIKQVADDANSQITELHNRIKDAIQNANDAAAVEAQVVHGTLLQLPPENSFIDGVENVTVEGQAPLQLADTPKGEGDPNAIVCRKPQQLADSRLMGPQICKRNFVWAALYRAGKDIGADGHAILPSEKSRFLNHTAMACTKVTMGGGYQGYMTSEYCN